MRGKIWTLFCGLLITVFLGACSSNQQMSDSSSPGDDVLWLEAPPNCAFTEITRISGQHRNTATFRSDQLSRLRATMIEEARERGGDAVIRVSISPVGENRESAASSFEYEGRVIQFEEPSCRERVDGG